MGYMREAILSAHYPVALTGAGISAPSGIPTFSSLWKGRPVRDFLGRDYFERDPVGFFELFCEMESWTNTAPNSAHLALAELNVPVITQNIDTLHTRAGSKVVLELHGTLRTLTCPRCGKVLPAREFCEHLRPLYAQGNTSEIFRALHCSCGALLDTDVVLYGDAVRYMEEACTLVNRCDLLVVIGTALQVYPAASLPEIARRRGVRVLIENENCLAALAE